MSTFPQSWQRLAASLAMAMAIAVLAGVCGHAAALEPVGKPVEDKRATAGERVEGMTPALASRLQAGGFKAGAPLLIRLFKEESELEIWIAKDDRFALFATYPICKWDGVLGPKLAEGDRQSPEGFYQVGEPQLLFYGRWNRALDLDYPNVLDRALGRSGSYIYIHGSCSSIGCFAMTDPVIETVFELAVLAMDGGQKRIAVHSFPFRMSASNLARHAGGRWSGFWRELAPAYEIFERTHVPPLIAYCGTSYRIGEGTAGSDGSATLREQCGDADGLASAAMPAPERVTATTGTPAKAADTAATSTSSAKEPVGTGRLLARLIEARKYPVALIRRGRIVVPFSRRTRSVGTTTSAKPSIRIPCNMKLPSCRKWVTLNMDKLRAEAEKRAKGGAGDKKDRKDKKKRVAGG
ncbi:MAG: hypothetical protein R3D33_01060 [Hyphomicrobiaceae bacterium]